MKLQIEIAGILMILLTLLHAFFPKYFNWEEEMKKMTLINRQMMAVHTFLIALVLLMMGLLCVSSADELIHSQLGK